MPPLTLFAYIARRTAFNAGALWLALAAIIFLVDLVESLRFAGKVADGDFGLALRLTTLRTFGLSQALTPFVFLFAAIWTFAQLNRRAEISVMRAAGLSIWRLIGPPALFAAVTGLAVVVVVDPASSRMTRAAEQLMDAAKGGGNLVRVFGDGIWLRQRDDGASLIVNAASLDIAAARLSRVKVWRMDADDRFVERIDAPRADITGKRIELRDARMQAADQKLPRRTPIYALPAALSVADLSAGAPTPETMSIWALPRFIVAAEAAGLPTVRHRIRFHDLCSTPLKLVAMVLIAAAFTLRPMRAGGAFQLLISAIAAGFGLYVLAEVASALGETGAAPAALAAWTPAVAAATAAATRLLHIEDG
ncbi:MAG: LptF/LptG family permease [Parvularculaceae bacterium]